MLKAADALRATGGRTIGTLPGEIRVSIDSRRIAPGETFLALRGERFDGHDFIGEAFGRGAAAAVIADPARLPEGASALIVPDTKAALLALAAAARRRSVARIVGITGSTGKTTTKTLVAQLLARAFSGRVIATPANENNEIGVAKLLLSLDDEVALAVVEMGARHPGDIALLTEMALPSVGVITNIGNAHLEIMGSYERLIEAKFAIFTRGAQPVLNALDAASRERARSFIESAGVFWFAALTGRGSIPEVDGSLVALDGSSQMIVRANGREDRFEIEPALPGKHNLHNLAAALAAALRLGVEPAVLADHVRELELPAGRYQRVRIGEIELIYDAYNASMDGMLATLDAFSSEAATRRIAVLGSMAELGAEAADMHERVGAAAARAGLDALLVGGAFAHELERGARKAGFAPASLVRFDRNDDAVTWLRAHGRAGDIVLLKASRMYRLEEILEGLRS